MALINPSSSIPNEALNSTNRRVLNLDEICPGCIAWVPLSLIYQQGSTLKTPEKGGLNHPICILAVIGTNPKDAIIYYALMRSFTNTTDPENSIPNFWNKYMKVQQHIPRKDKRLDLPDLRSKGKPIILLLEHRPQEHHKKPLGLRKLSYIDFRHVYTARCRDLRVYDTYLNVNASFFRLNMKSFMYLKDRMKICAGLRAESTWVRTDQLKTDFARRVKTFETTATTTSSLLGGTQSSMDIILLLSLLSTIVQTAEEIFCAGAAATTRSGDNVNPAAATRLHGILAFLLVQILTLNHAWTGTLEAKTTREIHDVLRILSYIVYPVLRLLQLRPLLSLKPST